MANITSSPPISLSVTTLAKTSLTYINDLKDWLLINLPKFFEFAKSNFQSKTIADYSGLAYMIINKFNVLSSVKFHTFLENIPAVYPACVLIGQRKFLSAFYLIVYVASNAIQRLNETRPNQMSESAKLLAMSKYIAGLLFSFNALLPAILEIVSNGKKSGKSLSILPVFLFIVSSMYSRSSNKIVADYYSRSASICSYIVAGNLLEASA